MKSGRIGITFSTFDLLHAGHISMLQEAKSVCDYLICGLQVDPTIDRPEKNKPIQSIVERYIQLNAVDVVDQIIPYVTEQDLMDILATIPIDVRIVGEEYKLKDFTGKKYCEDHGIQIYYNKRSHAFSSSELRKRVAVGETKGMYTTPTMSYNIRITEDDRIIT